MYYNHVFPFLFVAFCSRGLVVRSLLLPALRPFFSRIGKPSASRVLPACETEAARVGGNAGSSWKEAEVEGALHTLEDLLDTVLPEQSLRVALAEEVVPSLLNLHLFLETAHRNCHLRGVVKRVSLLALRKITHDLNGILRRLSVQIVPQTEPSQVGASFAVVGSARAWRLDRHWAVGPTGGVQLRAESKVALGKRASFQSERGATLDVLVALLKALDQPEAVCQLLLDLLTEYFTLRMAADKQIHTGEDISWQQFCLRLLLKALENEWMVTVFASNIPKSLQCVCSLLNHVVQCISLRDKDSSAVDAEAVSFCVSHCLNILLLLSMLPPTMSLRANYLELRKALPALEYLKGVTEEARSTHVEGVHLSDEELQIVTALLTAIYTQTQESDSTTEVAKKDVHATTDTQDKIGRVGQEKLDGIDDSILRKQLSEIFPEEVLQDLDSDQVPLRAYALSRIRKIVLAAKAAPQSESSCSLQKQVETGLCDRINAHLADIFVLLYKQLKVSETNALLP